MPVNRLEIQERIAILDDEIASLNSKQMAYKIAINSAYGALASPYFKWFDVRNAEAITTFGQVAIRRLGNKLNTYIQTILKTDKDYVNLIDTDSVYMELKDLVDTFIPNGTRDQKVNFLVNFGTAKLQEKINAIYDDLGEYINAFEQAMSAKVEVVSDKMIQLAKKRYVMNKLYDEGVFFDEPKMKIMGVEAIKSSTPTICRPALITAMQMALTGTEDETQKFIQEFKQEFKQANIDDISFPRSANGLLKYADKHTIYKKGTPIAVRGALIYNNIINTKKIIDVETIKSGDKVRFIYLKEPNEYGSNVISYTTRITEEFPDVYNCIDYSLQFEKSFLAPFRSILDSIGWSEEKKIDLMSFLS